jgi:hypothetical protein
MKLFILGGLFGLTHCDYLFAGARLENLNSLILVAELFAYLQLGTMICSVIRQLRISNGEGIQPLLLSVVVGGAVGTCAAFLSVIAYLTAQGMLDRMDPFFSRLAATSVVTLSWAISFGMIGIMTTPGGTQRARSPLRADYDDWE